MTENTTKKNMPAPRTSWENAARWYGGYMEQKDIIPKKVILPRLLPKLNLQKGKKILDLACGEGFFSREIFVRGANVIGVDISKKLIDIAKKSLEKFSTTTSKILEFRVSRAHHLPFLHDESMDEIIIVLALQNMENIFSVMRECSRLLKRGGKIHIVLNHPTFRIPRASSWGWDEKQKIQYRRVEKYLSEFSEEIQMHPGSRPNITTLTFHRPLETYIKAMKKNNLLVCDCEEWISSKISVQGPRARAENFARKEIPLFLYLAAQKI